MHKRPATSSKQQRSRNTSFPPSDPNAALLSSSSAAAAAAAPILVNAGTGRGIVCRPIPVPSQLQPILPAPPVATMEGSRHSSTSQLAAYPPQNAHSLLSQSASSQSIVAPVNRYGTPVVFQARKQRSGKWIPEEEMYADALIQLFEKGYLMDCENGCTLRSYLSRKLHCAPMRISKKYAGRGIGKTLFISRMQFNASLLPPELLEELKVLESRAIEREQMFYNVVCPESYNMLYHRSTFVPTNAIATAQPRLPVPINSHAQVAADPRMYGWPPAPSFNSNAAAKQHTQMPARAVGVTPTNPWPAAPCSLTAALQQSYFNAMSSVDAYNPQFRPAPLIHNPASAPLQNTDPIQSQFYAPNIPSRYKGPSVVAAERSLGPASSCAITPIEPSVHAYRVMSDDPTVCGLSPVPDFLSGFDKVTRNMQMHRSEGLQPHKPNSPSLTSQSFDDFHRFLGDDVGPLNTSPIPYSGHHGQGSITFMDSPARLSRRPDNFQPSSDGAHSYTYQHDYEEGAGCFPLAGARGTSSYVLRAKSSSWDTAQPVHDAAAANDYNESVRSSSDGRSSSGRGRASAAALNVPDMDDGRAVKRRRMESLDTIGTDEPASDIDEIHAVG